MSYMPIQGQQVDITLLERSSNDV